MQLVKITAAPLDFLVAPTAESIAERDVLIEEALTIAAVPTTPEENDRCSQVGVAIQTRIKSTEKDGLELRRPYNSRADEIKGVQDDYLAPLRPHLKRLSSFSAAWRTEQERKAEAERQARSAEIIRLQEQQRKSAEDARKASEAGDLAGALMGDLIAQAAGVATTAAIAYPEQVAEKTAGQSFQAQELRWECTDQIALWNARPDLCNAPTPKASAIKSTCSPEHPIPGLRLWWEAKVNFKANR